MPKTAAAAMPAIIAEKKYNLAQIAFLIACGSALQLTENFLPSPLPGMRIGLANISTLLGLVLFGAPAALEVAIYRPIVTSLTNGTFLSPGLVVSFWGSLASFAVMALCYNAVRDKQRVSLISISIVGALAHTGMQVAVIYYWLIPHLGIFALAPLLLIWAVIGGYLVGWSANYVVGKLAEAKGTAFNEFEKNIDQVEVPTVNLALKDKIKIVAAFALVVSTVFFETRQAYLILIGIVILLILWYRQTVPLGRFFTLWGAVVFSFTLPVLFTPSGHVLWQWHFIHVSAEGISNGVLFALRLIFLIFISVWIGVTDPSKLSQELAWILSPLKYFHFSVERVPRLISISMSFIPVVWEKLSAVRPKTLTAILDALAVFFAGLDTAGQTEAPAEESRDGETPAV